MKRERDKEERKKVKEEKKENKERDKKGLPLFVFLTQS